MTALLTDNPKHSLEREASFDPRVSYARFSVAGQPVCR